MDITLSVVIVEYFSVQEILECVSSLKAQICSPYEIIVSSNSCYDQRQQSDLRLHQPDIKWIFNQRNEGFAYAMNQGLKVARGRYLVIMNSDCTIQTPLDDMIDFIEQHPETGAIAPKMVDNEGNTQDTARPYVSVPRYVWRQVKRVLGRKVSILNSSMDYSRIQTVDWVIGAFIMASRPAYEATGGLDNRYFMYAEDLDWCTRIRQQGFEVVYFPMTVVVYKGTRRARYNSKYARIFINSHFMYWRRFGFFFGYPKRKKIYYDMP